MVGEEWHQWLKDQAKAERELEVMKYVFISIERTQHNTREKERLFTYDLPRELYERWEWVITWRLSKFRCMYPRDSVRAYFSYYDKRTGMKIGWGQLLGNLVSAKAQVTKQERLIQGYIAHQKQNNLFFDEANDVNLKRAYVKLDAKKSKVKELEIKIKSNHDTIRVGNEAYGA